MSDGFRIKTEEDTLKHKPVVLFGKDVTEIKCFRSSFICGICCGVVGGLGAFLFTSKSLLSTHIGFASIWVGVFMYWIPCRYEYERSLLVAEKVLKDAAEHSPNKDTSK